MPARTEGDSMKTKIMFRLTVVCVLFCSVSYADDVYLKTGFVIRNVQVVDTTDGLITIRRDGQNIAVVIEEVLRVEHRELLPNQKSVYELFSRDLYEQYQKSLPERETLARERREQLKAALADSLRKVERHLDALHPRLTWFNVGIGASYLQGSIDQAISIGAALSSQWQEHLFSIRFIGNTLPSIFADAYVVWDLGVLYGRITRASFGFASLSGGIALVGRNDRTLGIPIDVKLFWTPSGSFGIGLYVFANFNRTRSFAGTLVSVQF